MANKKIEYDECEVEEIIEITFERVNNQVRKLNPNKVKTVNAQIANNPNFKRNNGKLFKLYSHTFWIDKKYYGNQRVKSFISEKSEYIVAGKTFEPEVQDIYILVDRHKNNIEALKTALVNMFEADKQELAYLRKEVRKLKDAHEKDMEDLEVFRQGFVNLFMSSNQPGNSLLDVVSCTRSEDEPLVDELKTMFNDDLSIISKSKPSLTLVENNTLQESDILARIAELKNEGL